MLFLRRCGVFYLETAVSLILLNVARQHNDTDTVMFVVFGVGTLLLYLAFREAFHIPNQVELLYLLLGATMAIAGQYLLIMGFRYVTPVKGGILSSTRILIAAFVGPYITSDSPLSFLGWIGTLFSFLGQTSILLPTKRVHLRDNIIR